MKALRILPLKNIYFFFIFMAMIDGTALNVIITTKKICSKSSFLNNHEYAIYDNANVSATWHHFLLTSFLSLLKNHPSKSHKSSFNCGRLCKSITHIHIFPTEKHTSHSISQLPSAIGDLNKLPQRLFRLGRWFYEIYGNLWVCCQWMVSLRINFMR